MRCPRPASLLLSALLGGCARPRLELPPQLSDGTVVLLIQGSPPEAYVGPVADGVPGLGVDVEPDAGQLLLLSYRWSLEEFGWAPGRMREAVAGEPALPLPEPSAALYADPQASELSWSPGSAADSATYRDFRRPVEPPLQCLERRGCYPSGAPPGSCGHCPEPGPPPDFEAALPPRLIPGTGCAPGWATTAIRDGLGLGRSFEVCAPWTGTVPECGPAERSQPGGCARVGSDCPPGGWAPAPSGRRAIYLRAGAPGGDGTMASPYGQLSAGLAAAGRGDVLLLAPGHYRGDGAAVPAEVSVLGACASSTWIDGGSLSLGPGSELAELAVEGPMEVQAGLQATLRASVLQATSTAAVHLASGAAVELRSSLVWGGAEAPLLIVGPGGRLSLRDSELRGERGGLELQAGATATVTGTVLGSNAGRLMSTAQATLRVQHSAMHGPFDQALRQLGGRVELLDSWIEHEGPSRGMALTYSSGGRLRVERSYLTGSSAAVYAEQEVQLELVDVLARLGGSDPQAMGIGIIGSDLEVDRLWLEGAPYAGVLAMAVTGSGGRDLAPHLGLRDLSVAGCGSNGLHLLGGTTLAAEGLSFIQNHGWGVVVSGDLDPLSVELHRVRLEANGGEDGGGGMFVLGERRVLMTDVVVTRTLGAGLMFGDITKNPLVQAERVRVEDVHRAGAVCNNPGCDGTGLSVRGGVLDLQSFVLSGADASAIRMEVGAKATLRQGWIGGSGAAFTLTDAALDVSTLLVDVYLDPAVVPCDLCGGQ